MEGEINALLSAWDVAPVPVPCFLCSRLWQGGSPGEPCDDCKDDAEQCAREEARRDALHNDHEDSFTFGYAAW